MAYEKRRYQTEAIDTTLAAFAEKGRESVLLESPVESGKTYMALEMLHRLQEKLGHPLRINWVAPRHRLLQQVMEANRDLYRDSIRPVSLFASAPPEARLQAVDHLKGHVRLPRADRRLEQHGRAPALGERRHALRYRLLLVGPLLVFRHLRPPPGRSPLR